MDKYIFEFGFINDEDNLRLKETFKDNKKLKEMHIEIYPNNPMESRNTFSLFIRTVEKNVKVLNDGNRLVLKMNDRFETCVANILWSDITKCLAEISNGSYSSFIVNVQNIWYRISVLN